MSRRTLNLDSDEVHALLHTIDQASPAMLDALRPVRATLRVLDERTTDLHIARAELSAALRQLEELRDLNRSLLENLDAEQTGNLKLREQHGARDNETMAMFIGRLASTPRFDFEAHLERQRTWSEETFGPGSRAVGVVDHITKELQEVLANPSDLEEWIDVVILALGGALLEGHSPAAIVAALAAKQTTNEGREWPDWRTAKPGIAVEHVREVCVGFTTVEGEAEGPWVLCAMCGKRADEH